jgi:cytosine/creatinine deaminase
MNARTAFDLIFRNARMRSAATSVDIGVSGGRIAAIEPRLACEAMEFDAGGRLVLPGFVAGTIMAPSARPLPRWRR